MKSIPEVVAKISLGFSPPYCLDQLIDMVATPHRDHLRHPSIHEQLRIIAKNMALRACLLVYFISQPGQKEGNEAGHHGVSTGASHITYRQQVKKRYKRDRKNCPMLAQKTHLENRLKTRTFARGSMRFFYSMQKKRTTPNSSVLKQT